MRSIIVYSIEVVTLGNTKMKDRERSQKLADYLDRLLRPVLQKPDSELDFTDAELDTVLINVRKQKNFLDALNIYKSTVWAIPARSIHFFLRSPH
ncbi:MAG: hypothetical protein KAV87_00055 [Desulfobacteraceae bacterium]|nr:hypothetical protein [Desulfobacteraceae bacterium]